MSVQIANYQSLQAALINYVNGYTDAMGNIWPGPLTTAYPPPANPTVIWAYPGAPRPIPPYVSMNVIGKHHVGQAWQSPAIPVRDANGLIIGYGQFVKWDEDPTISIQAFGAAAPDLLDTIHDSLEAPWFHDTLDSLGLVARDHTDPRDISNMIDQQPERRWVMEITLGTPAELDQPQATWIEFVQLTENYAMPDSTPTVPDVVTAGPVTVGQ